MLVFQLLGAKPAAAQADSTKQVAATGSVCFIRTATTDKKSGNNEQLQVTMLNQPAFIIGPGSAVKYVILSVGNVVLKLDRQWAAEKKQPARNETQEQTIAVKSGDALFMLYDSEKGNFKPINRTEALGLLSKIRAQTQRVEVLPLPPPPPIPGGTPSEGQPYSTIHFVRTSQSTNSYCRTDLTLPNQRQFPLAMGTVVRYKVYSEGEILVTLESQCPSAYRSNMLAAVQLSVTTRQGEDHYVLLTSDVFKEISFAEIKKDLDKCSNSMKQEENIEFPINRKSIHDASKRSGKGQSTCFLISPDGYLVTNYHCVENSTELKVKGINGDFTTAHTATVIAKDPSNDLALLKLSDASLKFAALPFTLRTSGVLQAERIYALGFPVAAAMGDEIKITEGIISARSGVQGDISKFQISAAVNPGNSGGPLIDEAGNVVGVVYAKSGVADNAGYAVKAMYLEAFLKNIDNFTYPNFTYSLENLTLPQKVELLRKNIFILETK